MTFQLCFFYRFIRAVLLLLLVVLPSAVSAAPTGEYQIKAAMIYNMAKFTDWPSDALSVSQQHFTVCVFGNGRLGKAVEILEGKPVRGKTIDVRLISSLGELSSCQMLVVAESERKHVSTVIERTKNSRIMTIADNDGFAKAGGVVGFFVDNGKVRLEINTVAAQRHKLRIDAQVLQLARTVQETP